MISLLLIFSMYCVYMFSSIPFVMGVMLLLFSFFMVALQWSCGTSWYAYVLFMVYIGGVLVMLVYVCSVSNNTIMQSYYDLTPVFGVLILMLGSMGGSQEVLEYSTSGGGSSFVSLYLVYLLLLLILFVAFLSVVSILNSSSSLHFGEVKSTGLNNFSNV